MSTLLAHLLLEADIGQVSSWLSKGLSEVLDPPWILILPHQTAIVLYDVRVSSLAISIIEQRCTFFAGTGSSQLIALVDIERRRMLLRLIARKWGAHG